MPDITTATGTVSSDFVKFLEVSERRERVDTWQSPGRNGVGAQLVGFGDSRATFRLVRYAVSADVDTWRQNVEALQGQIVSLVDDWGGTYTDLLIVEVAPMRKVHARSADGSRDSRGEIVIKGTLVVAGG